VVWGTGGAFAVQALCLFLAAWSTWMIGGGRAAPRSGNKESFAHSIAEGWRFSLRNEAVRAGLLVTMITHFLIVPFTTLLPVFARDLLQVGANGQGLMLTAMGIGALVSAGLLASAGHRLPRGQLMLGASIIYGFIVAAFAASSWFALSLALMFATGLCQVCTNALVQTIIQSNSPPEFRGRVMAIFSMNMVLVTAGAVVYAALAEFAGPRWAVAAMGIAGSLAMLAMYFLMPRAKAIR
jgi:predicted MFS family arabinose efflux permease